MRIRSTLTHAIAAGCVALAALGASAVAAFAEDAVAAGSPPQVRAEGTNPRLGGKLAGYTAWTDAHGGSPDVVILGSSRAVQIDPRLIEQVSGSTAYNAAISSGAAREVLAVGDFVELLTPRDVPHLVVLLDLEAFDRRTPTRRVVTVVRSGAATRAACSDPEPCAARWTAAARAIVRAAVTGARGLPPASRNQRDDGMQVNGNLETLDAQGVDLAPMRNHRIQLRIASYRRGGGFDRLMPIPEAAIAKLLRQANARGDQPTLVLTAMHPDCVRRCGPAGWSSRRREVRAWLAGQAKERDFEVVDLSIPSRWGGSSASFFDEIHLRPAAAAQVVRRLDSLGAFDVQVEGRDRSDPGSQYASDAATVTNAIDPTVRAWRAARAALPWVAASAR